MEKSRLIATILSEVKAPALRERLLRQIAEEKDPGSSSLILSELEKLGTDPSG